MFSLANLQHETSLKNFPLTSEGSDMSVVKIRFSGRFRRFWLDVFRGLRKPGKRLWIRHGSLALKANRCYGPQ